jgi:hypothetical protein
MFPRRANIERLGDNDWSRIASDGSLAPDCEPVRFATGYAAQNRTATAVTLDIRVDGTTRKRDLEPRSAILVNEGQEMRLGSGDWPAKLG